MKKKQEKKYIESLKLLELDRNKRYVIFVPRSWEENDVESLSTLMSNMGFEGVVAKVSDPHKIRVVAQRKKGGEK